MSIMAIPRNGFPQCQQPLGTDILNDLSLCSSLRSLQVRRARVDDEVVVTDICRTQVPPRWTLVSPNRKAEHNPTQIHCFRGILSDHNLWWMDICHIH
jgi:hypothetical protein